MPFEQVPYTNFHGTNQDWMIQQIKKMIADWASYRENLDAAWADYQQNLNTDWADYQENINSWRQALDAAFTELHTYVHDYFDNLDVQEEVNNKLDEYLEDGTLDSILLPYFNTYTTQINNTVLTQNNKISSLETRVDNFLENTGTLGTEKDPELIDIRVAADNTVYPTAGDAVRNQIKTIATYRNSANLFDKSAVTPNKSLSTDRGIGVATINDLIDNNALSVGPIIPIEPGTYVSNSATNINSTRILAYDANGIYRGGIDASVSDGMYTYTIVGSNMAFIRFQYLPSILNIDQYMFVKSETLPETYEPYGIILTDGIVYDKVDELRNEINEQSDVIDSVADTIDTVDAKINDLLETGIEFTEDGFINFNGALINNANYKSTDFVNCIVGGTYIPYKYRLQMFVNTKIAYYNENKILISAITPTESETLEYVEGVLPYIEGANYVRFCTAKSAVNYYVKYASVKNIIVNGANDMNPCNYSGNDMSVFNKVLCIGDSLTSGTFNYRIGDTTGNYIEDAKYSYPTYLKKLTGCETTNIGNGGMSSAEWYNAHQNDDLSGYDCAIIQLGVNDRIRYTTWGETSETAFTNIINKLKTENNNIKIFVANIIPATSYSNAQYIAFSSALLAWVQTTYANDKNVIPLDMQQYGHTKDSPAYNCGHLSAYGYWRLAQDYKGYIGWYMNQNKTVFKEVQFIGTNYYYDPIV